MSRRGHLQLLPAPEHRSADEAARVDGAELIEAVPSASTGEEVGRRLAPGAPPSPGPVPLELAQALRMGEPTVWWGEKHTIAREPIMWTAAAGIAVLVVASLWAPGMWGQPLDALWKLLLLPLSPAMLLAGREYLSLRAVLVTDSSVIVQDHRGRLERLAFRNIRRVRRDFLTGGILLEGARHRVRLPPALADEARAAIASQTRHTLSSGDGPDDPLGWMP